MTIRSSIQGNLPSQVGPFPSQSQAAQFAQQHGCNFIPQGFAPAPPGFAPAPAGSAPAGFAPQCLVPQPFWLQSFQQPQQIVPTRSLLPLVEYCYGQRAVLAGEERPKPLPAPLQAVTCLLARLSWHPLAVVSALNLSPFATRLHPRGWSQVLCDSIVEWTDRGE